MKGDKVRRFMALAGQSTQSSFTAGTPEIRKLGAQLLLSEVLEYCIKGLGVIPEVNGVQITKPDGLDYKVVHECNQEECIDGLSDVAYTMYWNALAFGIPLEEAYDLVCDNNLEKFVKLGDWASGKKELSQDEWGCRSGVEWPKEVVRVVVVEVDGDLYAVGKDERGKVRKPSTYSSVDLSVLLK